MIASVARCRLLAAPLQRQLRPAARSLRSFAAVGAQQAAGLDADALDGGGVPVWGVQPAKPDARDGDTKASTIWPKQGTASSEFRGNQSPLYGDKTLPTGDDKGRHRRLIYRSKQRGWLELDLLLGEFALVKLPDYTDAQLDLWEQVLDTENPDLFKYLTTQLEAPSPLRENAAFQELAGWVDGKSLLTQR